MEESNKPYWKESLECYLMIFIILFIFLGTIIISGKISGTDWIAYLRDLSQSLNMNMLK